MAKKQSRHPETAGIQHRHEPVIGYEAEFTLFVGDRKRRPEQIFKTPQAIIREKMLPRLGRSFHLPSGGAIYFDTGVVEVATPIIEIASGCCVRAGRSLWEQIQFVRRELDAWEGRSGKCARLQGFSQHFNVSVPESYSFERTRRIARLLAYILPLPVMLLAANRFSTGVGVRPRKGRIEVTMDFTPDPELSIAAGALAIGIALGVMRWTSHAGDELKRHRIPIIDGFRPRKHTSRKGLLARFDCFPKNPFASDPNAAEWLLRDGRTRSLRQIATEIACPFRKEIRKVSDSASYEHVFAVLTGRARSLMDFPERPPRYDDVGRVIEWKRRSVRRLPRSRYERIIHRVIEHRNIRVGNATYQPARMRGWYEIEFKDTRNGSRRIFNLDELAAAAL